MMFVKIWSIFQWYLRPLFKWILRKTTRLCELQRICYGYKAGARRCIEIEKSLQLSKQIPIKDLIHSLDSLADSKSFAHQETKTINHATAVILNVKEINPKVHVQFVKSFGSCVKFIWRYKQVINEIEELRRTQYDSDNVDHEEKLTTLWNQLMPYEPLIERNSKQWQNIGFQGDDPKTDFRGMGMLGLENLLYFAKAYPGPSGHVLSHSHHPTYGYTFAIVGINITSMAYNLMKDGSAKSYIYNNALSMPINVDLFHQFYCYLFYEFDKLWIESKPKNMMEFSVIHKKFENIVRNDLSDLDLEFKIRLHVQNL